MPRLLAVTDDPERLDLWAARALPEESLTVVDVTDQRERAVLRDLAPRTAVGVFTALDPRTVRALSARAVRGVDRFRLVVCRGLARTVALDPLLDLLADAGLVVGNVDEVTVDGLTGVEVTLERAEGTLALPSTTQLATRTTDWAPTPHLATGLRVAVTARTWRWGAGLLGTCAVTGRWAEDPDTLRQAAPDVVVVDAATALPAHLARGVEAARAAGAKVVAVSGERAVTETIGDVDPVDLTVDNPMSTARRPQVATLTPPADRAAVRDALVRAARGEALVVTALQPSAAALLGEPVAELLRTPADALDDPMLAERHSVRLRRAVLSGHSVAARWRALAPTVGLPAPADPAVSVLLATRRGSFLPHAIRQVNAQRYTPLELVAVLHGDVDADAERGLVEAARVPLTVVRASGGESFGAALNRGTAAAGGQIVTKMDDDDWYGPDHVSDLVLALTYSGATLVGKGAEFYFLSDLDVTIRRVNDRPESHSRLVAGNTLTLRSADLDAVGGWQHADRSVDRRLYHDVRRAGGTVYRTHGFGHVVHRHGEHTWQITGEDLRRTAILERPGLDLAVADAAHPA